MDQKDLAIAFLVGIVTNILTFLITRNYTTWRERDRFKEEEKAARAEAADAAVGHLRSSYYAIKQLGLEVLDRQHHNKSNPEFDMTLWGIRHALEQMRLSLQGHMNAWRIQLRKDSPVLRDVEKVLQEDVIAGARMSPTSLISDIRNVTTPRSIEKKVSGFSNAPDPVPSQRRSKSLMDLMKESPGDRVRRMIAEGDAQGLEDEVVLEAGKGADADKLIALGGMLSILGSERAHGILVETVRNRYDELDASAKAAGLAAIVQFYVREDREAEGLSLGRELLERILSDDSVPNDKKAHAYNQMGMLLYGAGEFREAISIEEKAIQLAPNEAAYVANHAKTYAALGDTVKARELHEQALSLGELKDGDHLAAAIDFFKKIGDNERALELIKILRTVAPEKAAIKEVFS